MRNRTAAVLVILALAASIISLILDETRIASVTKVGNFAGTTLYPSSISGAVNNWAPTSLATATTISASLSADATLSGITGGASGRRLDVCNPGTFTLTLVHDATSTAANRFYLADAQNWTLAAGEVLCASFVYDGTASRWRMIAKLGETYPVFHTTATSGASITAGTIASGAGTVIIKGGAQSVQGYSSGGVSEIFSTSRPAGSLASPGVVLNNTVLGELDFNGYNGTSYVVGASIDSRTSENWSGTARGEQIEFNTTATGAATLTTDVAVIGHGLRMAVGTGTNPGNLRMVIGPVDGSFIASFGGHFNGNGAGPTFSSCGSAPAPTCNSTSCSDTNGTFTTGGGTTACTLTFSSTWTGVNSAGCIISPIGTATLATYTTSATTIVMSTAIAATKYHYICIGH